ncbi:unnamed protein product [Spirodela intermedia]|uniref:Uncharacterized protein n=2 Tax=Spirodela intermedia TaxID=51605 RepID=A0A7I8LGZ1_SPIIN|nr:unnamed protein product [Spirodela intermedia]CAA6671818.1 unnamed protein product [Spirodela intermedia]CAA7408946.1 unnamed protein product [Spirodela intermedia]
MKHTEINPNIKLLTIVLEGQEVGNRELIDINLLDEGLEVAVVSLKKEITLFVGEKRIQDFHNIIYVHPIGVHDLHSEPQKTD